MKEVKVRKHQRRIPSGGKTTVRRHTRTIQGKPQVMPAKKLDISGISYFCAGCGEPYPDGMLQSWAGDRLCPTCWDKMSHGKYPPSVKGGVPEFRKHMGKARQDGVPEHIAELVWYEYGSNKGAYDRWKAEFKRRGEKFPPDFEEI